jgi:hypothetical protein
MKPYLIGEDIAAWHLKKGVLEFIHWLTLDKNGQRVSRSFSIAFIQSAASSPPEEAPGAQSAGSPLTPLDSVALADAEHELDKPTDTISVLTAQANLAILEQKYPDHTKEIEPYMVKGRRLLAMLSSKSSTQQPPPPSQWFAANANFSACFPSRSPADRMQDIRDAGGQPETTDTTDDQGNLASVEVSVSDGIQDRFWTYYKTKDNCEAAIAMKNETPDRYR